MTVVVPPVDGEKSCSGGYRKTSQYPSQEPRKALLCCGRWGVGKCQALVFWIHSERGSPSVSGEGWAPLFLALSHHALDLSPYLICSPSLSPTVLLRRKATQLVWEHKSFGHKGKEMEANEDLKPPSFLSPCKPTPVYPGCAHSQGFNWNLSLTWVKELAWITYLGMHRLNQPHAGESHLALVHLNVS